MDNNDEWIWNLEIGDKIDVVYNRLAAKCAIGKIIDIPYPNILKIEYYNGFQEKIIITIDISEQPSFVVLKKLNTFTPFHRYLNNDNIEQCIITDKRYSNNCQNCAKKCCIQCALFKFKCELCIINKESKEMFNYISNGFKYNKYNKYFSNNIMQILSEYALGNVIFCVSCNNNICINNQFEFEYNIDSYGNNIAQYIANNKNHTNSYYIYGEYRNVLCSKCIQSNGKSTKKLKRYKRKRKIPVKKTKRDVNKSKNKNKNKKPKQLNYSPVQSKSVQPKPVHKISNQHVQSTPPHTSTSTHDAMNILNSNNVYCNWNVYNLYDPNANYNYSMNMAPAPIPPVPVIDPNTNYNMNIPPMPPVPVPVQPFILPYSLPGLDLSNIVPVVPIVVQRELDTFSIYIQPLYGNLIEVYNLRNDSTIFDIRDKLRVVYGYKLDAHSQLVATITNPPSGINPNEFIFPTNMKLIDLGISANDIVIWSLFYLKYSSKLSNMVISYNPKYPNKIIDIQKVLNNNDNESKLFGAYLKTLGWCLIKYPQKIFKILNKVSNIIYKSMQNKNKKLYWNNLIKSDNYCDILSILTGNILKQNINKYPHNLIDDLLSISSHMDTLSLNIIQSIAVNKHIFGYQSYVENSSDFSWGFKTINEFQNKCIQTKCDISLLKDQKYKYGRIDFENYNNNNDNNSPNNIDSGLFSLIFSLTNNNGFEIYDAIKGNWIKIPNDYGVFICGESSSIITNGNIKSGMYRNLASGFIAQYKVCIDNQINNNKQINTNN